MATNEEDVKTAIDAVADELAALTANTDIIPHSIEGESYPISKRRSLAEDLKALKEAESLLEGGWTNYSELST